MQLMWLVDDFVFGYASRAAEAAASGRFDGGREVDRFLLDQMASGAFPRLRAVLGDDSPARAMARVGRWLADPARFDRGLEALLDGFTRAAGKSARSKRQVTSRGSASTRRPRSSPRAS